MTAREATAPRARILGVPRHPDAAPSTPRPCGARWPTRRVCASGHPATTGANQGRYQHAVGTAS